MKATIPHKNAHIPIPTEKGLEIIRQLIIKAHGNTEQMAFLEAEIPPHILEAVVEYSEQLADREEQLADEAERLADMAEALEEEVRSIRQSIKKRMDSQQQKLINS